VIKALIFDFDGLIMDTESPVVDGWKAVYSEYGQEFPLHTWLHMVVGATAANFDPAAHLAALTGLMLDQPALQERVRLYRQQKLAAVTALPGVNDCVEAAGRLGLRLAVASSSPRAWVEGYLHQLNMFDDFEVLICREDVRQVKPDPQLFLRAREALGLEVDETLVFEDSPSGVLAARRAGMRVVAIPNAITAHATIQGASLMLSSLADLPLEVLLKQIEEMDS
jgi:HAD superfamily hydrolase (TIGR01509 family)